MRSIGSPKPSITLPISSGPTATRGVALAGDDRVVELNPVDFFERHRENVPVAKADHLRTDSSAGRRHYLAEIPDSGGRAARGEQKANDLDDFTGPRQKIRLGDLIEV